jgi:hypothetical protein
MKKLIIISLIGLISCNTSPIDGAIVTQITIERNHNDICRYYTNSNDFTIFTPSFYAPIGLYNIGDNIHFVKR